MASDESESTPRIWSAKELRKRPPAERDAVLALAAEQAEAKYRANPELMAFEASDGVRNLDEMLESGLHSGPPIPVTDEWWLRRKAQLLANLPPSTEGVIDRSKTP